MDSLSDNDTKFSLISRPMGQENREFSKGILDRYERPYVIFEFPRRILDKRIRAFKYRSLDLVYFAFHPGISNEIKVFNIRKYRYFQFVLKPNFLVAKHLTSTIKSRTAPFPEPSTFTNNFTNTYLEHRLPEAKYTPSIRNEVILRSETGTTGIRRTTYDPRAGEGVHPVGMTGIGILNRKRTLSRGRRHLTSREGEHLYYERRYPHTLPPAPVEETVSRSHEDRPAREHLLPETKGRDRTGIKDTGEKTTTSTDGTRLTTYDPRAGEGVHPVGMTGIGILNRKRTLSRGRRHLTTREGEHLYYERRDPHTPPPAPVEETVFRSHEDRPARELLLEDFEKPLKTAEFAPDIYKEQGILGGKSKSSLPETKGRAGTRIKDTGMRTTTSTGGIRLTTGVTRAGEGIRPVGMTGIGILNRKRTLSRGRRHQTSRDGEHLYYERRDPHTLPPAPVAETVSRSPEDRPAREHLLPETKDRTGTGIKDTGIRTTIPTGGTRLTTHDPRAGEGIHPVGMTGIGILNRKRTLSQGLRYLTTREGEHLYYERRDPHTSPFAPVAETISRSTEGRHTRNNTSLTLNQKPDAAITTGRMRYVKPFYIDQEGGFRQKTPGKAPVEMEYAKVDNKVSRQRQINKEETVTIRAAAAPPSPPESQHPLKGHDIQDIDMDRIADQVYQLFERKIQIERERRGL